MALYRRVLADYEPDARDLDAELRATAAYLRSLSKVYLDGLLDDRQRLIGAHAAALAARDDALRAADALGATHEEVVRQLRAAHGEEQRLRAAELAAARAEIDALRDEAVRAADALGATHGEEMQQLRAAHEEARATLAAELAMTRAEIGAMRRTRGWRALEVWWRAKRRLTGRS